MGRYEVLSRIAKGAMAEIYLARVVGSLPARRTQALRLRSGDLLVVKRLLPHVAADVEFARVFVGESELAAQIEHPNVVRVVEVSCEGADCFLAMEYVGWPSVASISRRARKTGMLVPYAVAMEIAAQACEGLHAAHELCDETGVLLEVVHGGITPQNLMLTEEGVVKVLDFGVPAARGAALAAGAPWVRGTLPYAYMSPEQCRGEALDRRTDVFALGIVLCELVTGRRIFRRATDALTVRAIAEEQIPDPRELYPQLPEEIREVILRALARDLDRRYGSAQEMAMAVRAALRALGESTSPRTLVSYVESECSDLIAGCRALREAALSRGAEDDGSGRMEALGRRTLAPTGESRTRSGRRWLAIFILALSAVVLGTLAGLAFRAVVSPEHPSGPPLRFGLPPAFPAEIGRKEFAGFFRYLEKRLGRPVELVVSRDYQALRSNLLRGAVDFAKLPPLQLVLAQHAAPDLRLLVGVAYEGSQTYHGYIVRRIDTNIRDIADLRGKRFCYVDRESTSGYLLPRHYLRTHGLDPDKLFAATRFSGHHTTVMKDILAGRCDAGASYSGVLLVGKKLGIDAYRLPVLVNTGDLPTDAVCASPMLARDVADKLRQALLDFDPQKHLGRRTLGRSVFVITRFMQHWADYAVVREIAEAEKLL